MLSSQLNSGLRARVQLCDQLISTIQAKARWGLMSVVLHSVPALSTRGLRDSIPGRFNSTPGLAPGLPNAGTSLNLLHGKLGQAWKVFHRRRELTVGTG